MLICDYAFTVLISGNPQALAAVTASAIVLTGIFLGLAFRSDRWWPLVTTASLMLSVLMFLLEWLNPELSRYAAGSAQIGLWMVVYLTVIAGVAERWLAGEPAAGGRGGRRARRPSGPGTLSSDEPEGAAPSRPSS